MWLGPIEMCGKRKCTLDFKDLVWKKECINILISFYVKYMLK